MGKNDNKFGNKRKTNFIGSRPSDDIESSDLSKRCKFNFSYFDDSQPCGQSFSDWESSTGMTSLASLLTKVKEYTRQPLIYWQNQRVGGGGLKVFEIYKGFPKKSAFSAPPSIPHDVHWARFRLGNKIRLAGFVMPGTMDGQEINGFRLDKNTFYVVFLDKDHMFYQTEKD
ncbi:hypothetical protein [Pelagibaculum spongiae]|uniref:Uncharacterized protein n=1 Tax=Pelagibaculum spongiae TaxID=2080658 RepID=A0A2V1GT21_9GAMM|nr:hypothetical protein [Pelagibaculum spongiae]PVZ68164.1 hypothetical protein DC094_12740 [Pelagibaculum spongiae]